MLLTYGIPLGCGLVSALLYLLVRAGGMGWLMLAYLAPLPLFAVGFGFGRTAVLVAVVAGMAGVAVATGSGLFTLAYGLTVAVPVAVTVRNALLTRLDADGRQEWYPMGPLLLMLAGMAMAGFLALVVLASGEPGGLEGFLHNFASELVSRMSGGAGSTDNDSVFRLLATVLPGLTGVSWLVMVTVNGLLAQVVVKRLGANVRPTPPIRDLELPSWSGAVFAVCCAAAFVDGPVGFLGLNGALILAVPFGFAGLAVVHAFAATLSLSTLVLIGFYGIVFLLGWPIVFVVGLGLIEQWMGLRRRWSAGPHQGDE